MSLWRFKAEHVTPDMLAGYTAIKQLERLIIDLAADLGIRIGSPTGPLPDERREPDDEERQAFAKMMDRLRDDVRRDENASKLAQSMIRTAIANAPPVAIERPTLRMPERRQANRPKNRGVVA